VKAAEGSVVPEQGAAERAVRCTQQVPGAGDGGGPWWALPTGGRVPASARVEEVAAAHGAVLDTVRQQDAEAAAASMRAHLAETQAVIKLALEESGQVW